MVIILSDASSHTVIEIDQSIKVIRTTEPYGN